ncbi:phosphoribosylglycinamide formyltransferase [Candidatus Parcubacteria bacterium]|nr:phosphoribosylglycinamide formyltransferase [Candidatus Parcubacteria bacterium]
MKKKRIGILISGGGTNMMAIASDCKAGKVNADVVFVGADNPDAKGLVWAKENGISTFFVDYKQIKMQVMDGIYRDIPGDELVETIHKKSTYVHSWYDNDEARQLSHIRCKVAAERELMRKVTGYSIDLLALAGFMQVFTSNLIDVMNMGYDVPRIMNIHPALLPSFPGVNGYEDTFNYGCKVGGCTVHFVDYDEDTGPIIGQRTFPIFPGDTLSLIKKRGLKEEYQLFPECIQQFAEGGLWVRRNEKGRKVVEITETHNNPSTVAVTGIGGVIRDTIPRV